MLEPFDYNGTRASPELSEETYTEVRDMACLLTGCMRASLPGSTRLWTWLEGLLGI